MDLIFHLGQLICTSHHVLDQLVLWEPESSPVTDINSVNNLAVFA